MTGREKIYAKRKAKDYVNLQPCYFTLFFIFFQGLFTKSLNFVNKHIVRSAWQTQVLCQPSEVDTSCAISIPETQHLVNIKNNATKKEGSFFVAPHQFCAPCTKTHSVTICRNSSSFKRGTPSSFAFVSLEPASSPANTKLVFLETEEETFPPCSSMSFCASFRFRVGSVPVRTKIRPAKRSPRFTPK